MRFCDKLIRLRAEKGLSQEGLANLLGVSRQAVSKWEAGATMPELQKLIAIADLFGTSVDYLVRDEMEAPAERDGEERAAVAEQLAEISGYIRRQAPYEYKSQAAFAGLPLVHIHLSRGSGRPAVAKGIFAVGDVAIGAVALGGIAVGLLALGGVSLGLLLALGGVAAGLLALGGAAFGVYVFGAVAIGVFALGSVALGARLAIGAVACAPAALGAAVEGTHTLLLTTATEAEIGDFLRIHGPHLGEWLIRLLMAAGNS